MNHYPKTSNAPRYMAVIRYTDGGRMRLPLTVRGAFESTRQRAEWAAGDAVKAPAASHPAAIDRVEIIEVRPGREPQVVREVRAEPPRPDWRRAWVVSWISCEGRGRPYVAAFSSQLIAESFAGEMAAIAQHNAGVSLARGWADNCGHVLACDVGSQRLIPSEVWQ